jgi:hypothetical protein
MEFKFRPIHVFMTSGGDRDIRKSSCSLFSCFVVAVASFFIFCGLLIYIF